MTAQQDPNSPLPSASTPRNAVLRALPMAAFLAAILLLSRIHYLWFHTAVEFTSAIIGITLYIIARSSYHLHRNDFLVFISQAFFWSAGLDIVHAMVYPGMGLAGGNFNPPPQLWIGARGLEAIVLLLSPLVLAHPRERAWTFWVMGVVSLGWVWLVFSGFLPDFFIPGQGLTPIKVASEYAIIAMLLLAGIALSRRRSQLPEGIGVMLFGMLGLTIATELCFTLYHSMYDALNLLGHVLKVLSYGLMLRIVLTSMIDQPFRVMSRSAYSFDAIPLSVLELDRQGVICASNAHGKAAHPDSIGQSLFSVWKIDDSGGLEQIRSALDAGNAFVGDIRADDRWVNVVLQPVSRGDDSPTQGFVCVLSDITDRHESERALAEAKDHAEEVGRELARKNDDLERFTLILAHHLQEPVRRQHLFTQILLSRLPHPLTDEMRQAADFVLQGARRQQQLVLDVQRYLSAGQGHKGSCTIDAALSLSCHAGERNQLAASGGLDVTLALGKQPVAMAADDLSNVFAALFDNALSFRSPERPLKVVVGAEGLGERIKIWVSDNGIGIPKEYRDRVFNIFERLSVETNTGTGIGLALAKKLVESAGGRIWVDEPDAVGARICLELPVAKDGLPSSH